MCNKTTFNNLFSNVNPMLESKLLNAPNDGFINPNLSCHLASTLQLLASSGHFVSILRTELNQLYDRGYDTPPIIDNLCTLFELMRDVGDNTMAFRVYKHRYLQSSLREINNNMPLALRINVASDPSETLDHFLTLFSRHAPVTGRLFDSEYKTTLRCKTCRVKRTVGQTEMRNVLYLHLDTTSDADLDIEAAVNSHKRHQSTIECKCPNPDCKSYGKDTPHRESVVMQREPDIALCTCPLYTSPSPRARPTSSITTSA